MIDTHIHVWDFDQAEYSWLEGNTSILNRTYSIDEIAEERISAGITGGILVQAANNFEDTNWMLQLAAQTDWLQGVVGWLPLMQPDETAKAFEKYRRNPYFKGVRHLIHDEANPRWLLQDAVVESLKMLAANNIPYDLVGVLPEHIETALELAALLPNLRMVFDHLNQPPIASKEQFGNWGDLMKTAAQHPNFYAKISGLGTASGNFGSWTTGDLEPYVSYVLEHFGSDRCFCGGDWPVSLLAGSYTSTWRAYQDLLSTLLPAELLIKVTTKNAAQFYNLSIESAISDFSKNRFSQE